MALSGMGTADQIDENVAVAGRSTPMTARQREVMLERLAVIREKGTLICTACGYCMPCPHGVDIPANFTLLSRATLLGMRDLAESGFTRLRKHADGDKSALRCKKCGKCLPKCPNDVPIIGRLGETAELLRGK